MVSRKKPGPKRTNKSSPKRRTKKSQKLKNITFQDKLALYLNDALSLENAAIERLKSRIRQTRLQDSKVQLQHHLEETREQQNRLKQLISTLGGEPTRDKGHLPIPSSSKFLENSLKKHMTGAEVELRGAKEDAIVESAEIVLYDTLIQLAQKASTVVGGDAIPILTQNLDEERAMMDWIKANTPILITQLWPDIEDSIVGTRAREDTSYAEAGEGKEEQGVSTISDTTSEVL
jgi:ferritin-like metal-binding protein YciE